ncbi:hypothetical protein AVEN_170246-1 [Araneus ventricosus]|uniref:Mutator-like transposase domain-containing protein n=1 Tax=Araneus ventricosus TaxID=182803 RepID=A0A4Y2N4K2_ARAVE|nr:hypothetical protein AVEN_170246-1 [Araneus ventricosus]
MPRSARIFKKRSRKIYKKSEKVVTQVENLSPNVQKTCAIERKIPNIDDFFQLKIQLKCEYTHEFSSSDFHEGTQIATVNIRYVYALRSIGKGAEAGRMFCPVMNLPQPPTRFQEYNKRLLNATRAVCESTMQKAAKEAIVENNSDNNIAVAVDGTWQKRGYTSHILEN